MNRALVFAGVLLAGIVLAAVLAPWISPHDPFAQHLGERRIPPVWHAWLWQDPRAGWVHPFGTDKVGRDYLSRLLFGARISLAVGIGVALVSTMLGAAIGIAAGYWGGRVDLVANFLIQARLAMPVILVALAAIATVGGSLGAMVVMASSLLLWDRAAVMTRSATQQLRSRAFVRAARALGCSDLRIIVAEIFPNLLSGLEPSSPYHRAWQRGAAGSRRCRSLASASAAGAILLGLMLAEAKEDIFFAPWAITIPGAALFLLVLSTSVLGNALQDLRGGGAR